MPFTSVPSLPSSLIRLKLDTTIKEQRYMSSSPTAWLPFMVNPGGPSDTLVSVEQIAARAGVAPSTVWAWNRSIEGFPVPLKISSRCTRWIKSEIDEWFESCRDV